MRTAGDIGAAHRTCRLLAPYRYRTTGTSTHPQPKSANSRTADPTTPKTLNSMALACRRLSAQL